MGVYALRRKKEEKAMTLVIGEKELEQLPVSVDPEIVSGAPVFQGTRVPVEALINNLEAGDFVEIPYP
jgi:uncharacterized protein (DUF433 family)